MSTNKYKVWYTICFLLLGVIDQRRGSAVGEVQMFFANLTGVVMALMVLPSLNGRILKDKVYRYWTPVCLILSIVACGSGKKAWGYKQPWVAGVLSVAMWSYLVIYIIREWNGLSVRSRIRKPFFWCVLVMLVLMQISAHGGILPLWYMLIFGGFYLIGISEEKRVFFWDGMLNGIIIWFFIQQTMAFAFRPYDYVRYKGLYAGETQNGLFYMIVYCAFLIKWIWEKEKKGKRWITGFYFFFAAVSISFMVFTGGRSAILGMAVATLVLITVYDIIQKKSFYRWFFHGVALVLCMVITFPIVYCGIRYLPTVLHHPIWYEGEYREGGSICSFDTWDSPKYISFEEAIDNNVGRILDAVGIDYHKLLERLQSSISGMKVYAAELSEGTELGIAEPEIIEPGSTPQNPFMLEGIDIDSAFGARKVIYTYYWNHLNWRGHQNTEQGFYITEFAYISHAHNAFMQMAYDYGIPVGVLYIVICVYSLVCTFRMRRPEQWICMMFLISILCFGLTEMVVVPGQITVPLVAIIFCFVGEKGSLKDSNREGALQAENK